MWYERQHWMIVERRGEVVVYEFGCLEYPPIHRIVRLHDQLYHQTLCNDAWLYTPLLGADIVEMMETIVRLATENANYNEFFVLPIPEPPGGRRVVSRIWPSWIFEASWEMSQRVRKFITSVTRRR